MKYRIRNLLLIIVFVIGIFMPQVTKSYDFDTNEKKQNAYRTREEIYDLYKLAKETANEKESQSSEFGVVGYNGVCSNVTVNGKTIPLDNYIAGVIKQEMGGNNLEALKAQAIAARSFLLNTHEKSSNCSVTNGQSYQAYTDSSGNDIYMQAAKETSGMVVKRNDKIAHTQYQSYPAGQFQTEDSNGWHVKFQRFADDPSTKWTWNGPAKSVVLGSYGGTEMAYDNPHNWGMSQTIAMYLATKENYNYEQIIKTFYNEPIVKLSDGSYDGNVEYGNSAFGEIIYWNQGDFHQYLSTDPLNKWSSGTIQNSGCGPTAVAIVVSSMYGRKISPIETTSKVCSHGSCSSSGTYAEDLVTTLKSDYNMNVTRTNDGQSLINSLKSGKSLVIALMGPGIFTTWGHYIVLTGVNDQGQVSVADPGSRERTNKKWFSFNTILEQKQASQFIVVTR